MNYFIIILLFVFSSASAEIYKWTDKDGNVHFGDRPVNKEKAEQLTIDTETKTGVTQSSDRTKERARMAKELETDRKERADKRKEVRLKKAKKKRECAYAKDRLKRYQRASGVYKLDAKGERQYYSHEQRAKNEKKFMKAIAKNCR